MSKGIWVASKSSTAIAFVEYSVAPQNGIPTVLRRIVIKGGAGYSVKDSSEARPGGNQKI